MDMNIIELDLLSVEEPSDLQGLDPFSTPRVRTLGPPLLTLGLGFPNSIQSNVTVPPSATVASPNTFKNSGGVDHGFVNFGIS